MSILPVFTPHMEKRLKYINNQRRLRIQKKNQLNDGQLNRSFESMTFCLEYWVLTNFLIAWVLDLHLRHWKKFVCKVFKDSNCCEKMIYGKLKVGKMIIISPSASQWAELAMGKGIN